MTDKTNTTTTASSISGTPTPIMIIASSSTSTSTEITASNIHCLVCFDTLVSYFKDLPSSPSCSPSSSSSTASSSSLTSFTNSILPALARWTTNTSTTTTTPKHDPPLPPTVTITTPNSSLPSPSPSSFLRIPPIADHIRTTYGSLFNNSCPLFITLKVRDKGNNTVNKQNYTILRGCIGSLTPRSLMDIPKYTLKSAFEDKRFSPLTRKEIPFLQISISLLINFELVHQWNDWIIGLHGIMIEFTIDERTYNGTFLPEVAKEQNWDHKETVTSLVRKCGYTNKQLKDFSIIKVTRYQSSKTRLTYDEYCSLKKSLNYV